MSRVGMIDYRSRDFTKKFGDSLTQTGFAGVVNGPIDPIKIARFHALMRAMAALGPDVLSRYAHSGLNGQRGMVLTGERAVGELVFDSKFFCHVGPHTDDFPEIEHPAGNTILPNVWISELPEMRDVMIDLFRAQYDFSNSLLGHLERYLGLSYGGLQEMVPGGDTILRGLYYPPVESGTPRAAAHGDINLITTLIGAYLDDETQSDEPRFTGLEVKDIQGNWHQVLETPGCVMVNVGDMLEEYTRRLHEVGGGRVTVMPSTVHRVVAAPGIGNLPRTAAPMFLHPDPRTVLSWRDGKEFTAGEFLMERLQDLGLVAQEQLTRAQQVQIIAGMNAGRS